MWSFYSTLDRLRIGHHFPIARSSAGLYLYSGGELDQYLSLQPCIVTEVISTSWHQGARQKFQAPANFLSFSVFRLLRGTLVARYVVLNLTFLISSLFHGIGDMAGGIPWRESGAWRFFVMQDVGFMTEDAVQGLFRTFSGHKRSQVGRPRGWKRALGSVWLLFWLFWTTPGRNYPIA